MNVRELKELLESVDESLPVLVAGYEFGYQDASPLTIGKRTIAKDYWHDPEMGGPHEIVLDDQAYEGYDTFEAFVIGR